MRTLVAGVGNVFLGDDGFGVEVVRRLARSRLPTGTQAADFGVCGVHLAYELLNGYEGLVIVDALRGGEPPGTLTVLEPDAICDRRPPEYAAGTDPNMFLDAHDLGPAAVLATFRRLGGQLAWTRVVGCEPARFDQGPGLSPPVAAVVDTAVHLVHELLASTAQH